MKNDPTTILKRQYELLVRHCAPGTFASLDDVLENLKPSWCKKLVPVLVPQLANGEQYRRLVVDVHADLTKHDLTLDHVQDDAFFPADAHGVRFTIADVLWRDQMRTVTQFKNGGVVTGLGLFAAVLYLLDVCTSCEYGAVTYPLWANTVSNQACVLYPRDRGLPDNSYIRSESVAQGQGMKLKRLVVSSRVCRTSLTPFYLNDLRMS